MIRLRSPRAHSRQALSRRERGLRSLRYCRALHLPLLLILVAATPTSAQLPEPAEEVQVLRPGDRVEITVWQMPEMSGEFAVTVDGTLAHPRYSQLSVVGAVDEAEQRIDEFLKQLDRNAQFTMQPLFRVFIGGEVARPDLYHHGPDVTISQALTLAGGTTERGRLDRVRLVRDGATRYLDLRHPGAAASRIPVRSGDEITVLRRSSIFRDYVVPVSTVISAITGLMRVLRYY